MAGLIAGAMQGAGEGAMRAGAQFGDYLSRSALQSEAAEIMKERDARLTELRKGEMQFAEDLRRKPYQEAAAEVADFKAKPGYDEGADTARPRSAAEIRAYEKDAYKKRGLIGEALQMEGQDITREEAGKGRDLHRELAAMTDNRIREEAKLTREQQMTLHRERMTEIREQFKNTGLSVQSTDKGLAIVNAREGTSTLLKDADGNPIKAAKQEDSLAVVKAIGELAKSMETTNPEMAKRLGDIAIGVLSGKTGKDLGPQPTEADIAGLKQRAGNKAAVDFFEGKFGKGSAARYLGSADAGGRAGIPLVSEPPGSASVQTLRERKARAIADEREAEDARRARDEERKKEYGDATY